MTRLRWLLSLALVAGCATTPRVIFLPEAARPQVKMLQGYKPCRVQWCPTLGAWMNYDNYSACQVGAETGPIVCDVIYIPEKEYCFKRVMAPRGSVCP